MFLCLMIFIGLTSSGHSETKSDLKSLLKPLILKHQGDVAIAIKELHTGETFFHNPDQVMPTASLIKLPILIELLYQVREGKIKFSDTLKLRKSDKVPGSGLLTKHFSEGTTFPLKDAMHLMMAVSDNTATNLILDKIGMKSVNARMQEWGLKETRVNAKVFRGSTTSIEPARTKKYGLGSTTAREMVTLLEMLETGNRLKTPTLKQTALTQLKQCENTTKFSRYLPKDVILAHKTGSVSRARTDAGLLYFEDHTVAICVLTANNKDRSWGKSNAGDLLCAKVAKLTVEYFRSK